MRICWIWDSCIGLFLIAVEEGVFYFLNSSLPWLMPFGRELPSMVPFADLMDDFRVSERECNPPAYFRTSLCWTAEQFLLSRGRLPSCHPKTGHVSQSSLSLKWQRTDRTDYMAGKGRTPHVFASLLISLVLARFVEMKKGNKFDFWKITLVPGIGSCLAEMVLESYLWELCESGAYSEQTYLKRILLE